MADIQASGREIGGKTTIGIRAPRPSAGGGDGAARARCAANFDHDDVSLT